MASFVRRNERFRAVAAALGLALSAGSSCAGQPVAAELPLEQIADVPLGQATARFDYECIDPQKQLLFIADLAQSKIRVVDLRTDSVRPSVEGVEHVHGVLAVPAHDRLYATATGANQLAMVEETSGKIAARVPAGEYPDGLAIVPALHKVYVSDEHGKTVAVIDTARNALVRLIPIGGQVGNTQFNPADGLIYSNDQTNDELVAINPATDEIVGRWKWAGCRGSHGLQLSPERKLVYAACEDNDRLATLSLTDHKERDIQSVGGTPDVIAADFGLGRLYVAAENGVIAVFDITSETPRKIAEGKLADNAHVVGVDPTTHRVFFPLRNVAGRAVLRVMEPVR